VAAAAASEAGPAPSAGGPAAPPGRDRRADGFRVALTSRGAGWAAAAALAGAVVGLSVAMATSASPTVVAQPEGVAGLGGAPAGAARAAAPAGAVRALAPVRMRLRAPARRSLSGGRLQAPARPQVPAGPRAQVPAGGQQAPVPLRAQVPAGAPQVPAGMRIQMPAGLPLQAPAQLRTLAPVPGGALAPVPRIWVMPGKQPAVTALTPGGVRVRIRPAQVRVQIRVPANAPIRALLGGPPRPLRVVLPGPRPAEAPPVMTPARLRIAFRKGQPVPARLVLPARLPGRARLQIKVPARARITPAVPAPPLW